MATVAAAASSKSARHSACSENAAASGERQRSSASPTKVAAVCTRVVSVDGEPKRHARCELFAKAPPLTVTVAPPSSGPEAGASATIVGAASSSKGRASSPNCWPLGETEILALPAAAKVGERQARAFESSTVAGVSKSTASSLPLNRHAYSRPLVKGGSALASLRFSALSRSKPPVSASASAKLGTTERSVGGRTKPNGRLALTCCALREIARRV